MLRAAVGQAVAVACAGNVRTAAAVRAPVLPAIRGPGHRGRRGGLRPARQRGITITTTDGASGAGMSVALRASPMSAPALIRRRLCRGVRGGNTRLSGWNPTRHTATRLSTAGCLRALILLSGRCLIGEGEVLIGDQTAPRALAADSRHPRSR